MAKKKKEDIEEEVLEQEEMTSEESEAKVEPKTVEEELGEMKDKYLRLYSEFENFRRRNGKSSCASTRASRSDRLTNVKRRAHNEATIHSLAS